MRVLICLPIRNEEKILEKNVNILLNFLSNNNWCFAWEIVLVVNNSNDKSSDIAGVLAEENEKISFLEIEKGGKGRAIKYCFDQFLDRDILVYMDADLAVSLENFSLLINNLLDDQVDLVIGSRMLPESKTNRSFSRNFISNLYNLLSKLFLKHKFSDLQCGFKAIKSNVYKEVRSYLKDNNWFFDTEWIAIIKLFGFKIKEMPVDWQENRFETRKSGVKVFKDGWQFLKALYLLRIRLNKIAKQKKLN
jgi:glycosyltransferase involved in cell wall biosynthesis